MIKLEDIQKNYYQRYISIRKHPFIDLYILNYTHLASQKSVWNEITLNSRGLIINKMGEIISYPFRKFFELEQLPLHLIPKTSPLKIYEKLDGSLGIMYWYNGKPYISTRGSFTSYQAIRATEILYKKYANYFQYLKKDYTYLFEIIVPENRIVVDYGETEDLFLLCVMDNVKYKEINIEELINNPFPLPRTLDQNLYTDISKIKEINDTTIEGYVVIFENNFRIKIKNQLYKNRYTFYTRTLKKYALNKALHGYTNLYFESNLCANDLKWMDKLIIEILKLKEVYSGKGDINSVDIISKKVYSNQFYIDKTCLLKKYFVI